MSFEIIAELISSVGIVYIFVILFLFTIWLLINRKALKRKTKELKTALPVPKAKPTPDIEKAEKVVPKEEKMTSKLTLPSATSAEDLEKQMPQTLMDLHKDETEDEKSDQKSKSDEDMNQKSDEQMSQKSDESKPIVAPIPVPIPESGEKPVVSAPAPAVVPVVAPIPTKSLTDSDDEEEEFTLEEI